MKVQSSKFRVQSDSNVGWAKPTLRLLSILCTILIFTACPKKPVNPSSTISFSGSTPGSNSVYMAQNSTLSSGDVLGIDVKAKNISSNVYGAAFDVDFDSSKMTYNSYAEGNFLESGGNTVGYQVALQSGNSGKLLVGVSRQGSISGNSGRGTLITLKFNVSSGGNIDFSNNVLKDLSNQTISGITWYGGTMTVQ